MKLTKLVLLVSYFLDATYAHEDHDEVDYHERRLKRDKDVVFRGEDGFNKAGHRCVTEKATEEHQRALDENFRRFLDEGEPQRKLAVSIPVIFHVIYNKKGAGNIPDSMINRQINVLNGAFASSGFSFVLAGIRRYKHDTYYKGCYGSNEASMKTSYAVDTKNYLNVCKWALVIFRIQVGE